MTETPDNPYPARGNQDTAFVALTSLASPLAHLSEEIAELVEKYSLDKAEIALTGETNGTIVLTNGNNSNITVHVTGSLNDSGQLPSGTPYIAHYSGEFFWRPSPDSEDFVKSGETVRAGQLVGWAMGESKNMSFGLRADQDGVIRLIAGNATKVTKGETLLYYIESTN